MPSSRGRLAGIHGLAKLIASVASNTPSAPPHVARIRASTRNCRTISHLGAPSAMRVATSLRRPTPRARSSVATLEQAMSKSMAVPKAKSKMPLRDSPAMWSRNGTTWTLRPRAVSGYFSAWRPAMTFISACACARVTFGRSLATTSNQASRGPGSANWVTETNCGIQKSTVSTTLESPIWKSAWRGGNWTGAVAAPTTLYLVGPAREKFRTCRSMVPPTSVASESNRRRQTSLPSTNASPATVDS